MKCKFVLAAVAAVAFASCSEKAEMEPGTELVNVEIAVSCGMTKASGVTEEDESKINDVQVFVFSGDGKLEAYGKESGGSVSLGIFNGKKTVYALVNAETLTGITDLATFTTKTSDLTQNRTDNFVMAGMTEFTVEQKNALIPISVKRLVSKVSLVKVENNLDAIYGDLTFKVLRSYLINVVGTSSYFSDVNVPAASLEWYNKMGFDENDGIGALTYDDYGSADMDPAVTYDYYCYPNPTAEDSSDEENWTARYTRLVVEIELGGKTYFYPVNLKGISRNNVYNVTLTVTRPGSLDPDFPYDEDAASVDVTVAPWDQTFDLKEEI